MKKPKVSKASLCALYVKKRHKLANRQKAHTLERGGTRRVAFPTLPFNLDYNMSNRYLY